MSFQTFTDNDGTEYHVFTFDTTKEALESIEAEAAEGALIMCPLDGVWMTPEEARQFCTEAIERGYDDSDVPVAVKYIK